MTSNRDLRDDLIQALADRGMDRDLAEAKAAKVTFITEDDGTIKSLGLWLGGEIPRDETDPIAWLAQEIVESAQSRPHREPEPEPEPKNEYEAVRERKEAEQKAKYENRMNLREITGRAPRAGGR